ncbi:hypothetical protein ACVFYP_19610 [Roseomonas sp. F4]
MRLFRLRPRPEMLWHADWMATSHLGECLVSARDEAEARGLARVLFTRQGLVPYDADPWGRGDLVEVATAFRALPLPHGVVVALPPPAVAP